MINKFFVITVFFLLFSSNVLAFIPENTLGDAAVSPDQNFLTAAGVARQCSQYPSYTGTFIGVSALYCPSQYSLVNVYQCLGNTPACDNGYKFIQELEGGEVFSGVSTQFYAFECYSCASSDACKPANNGPKCQTSGMSVSCSNGNIVSSSYCNSNQVCDPNSGSCVSKTSSCVEQWSCSTWGACKSDGTQLRACSDQNSCGTFNYAPQTSQSCTYVPASGSGKITFQNVKADKYEIETGEKVTVTADVTVSASGSYWLEAGSGVIGALSIVDIRQNTCNPGETHFANKLVQLSAGTNTINFEIVPQKGRNAFWVAQVTGCGGGVVERLNSVENILVGIDSQTSSGSSFLSDYYVYIIFALIAIGGYFAFVKK